MVEIPVGPEAGHVLEKDEVIPSTLTEGNRVVNDILRLLVAHDFDSKDVYAVRLALDEAVVNAMKHGNQYDPGKSVRISYRVNGQRVDIRIKDDGPGFNPSELPDPLAEENLERPCGRGVMLIHHYMTFVEYSQAGNEVSMSRLRKEDHDMERERQEQARLAAMGGIAHQQAASLMTD